MPLGSFIDKDENGLLISIPNCFPRERGSGEPRVCESGQFLCSKGKTINQEKEIRGGEETHSYDLSALGLHQEKIAGVCVKMQTEEVSGEGEATVFRIGKVPPQFLN